MNSENTRAIETTISVSNLRAMLASCNEWRAFGFAHRNDEVVDVSFDPNILMKATDGETIPLTLYIEKQEVTSTRHNG